MKKDFVLLTTSLENFLATLKQQGYSGIVQLAEPKMQQWSLFLHLGRLIYANGGCHPVRRLQRQVDSLLPNFNWDEINQLLPDSPEPLVIEALGWDYECLRIWNKTEYLNRGQSLHLISNIIVEIFFDIMQAESISYQQIPYEHDLQSYAISLLDPVRLTQLASQQFQDWADTTLGSCSPNSGLLVQDAAGLNASLATLPSASILASVFSGQSFENKPIRELAQRYQIPLHDLAIATAPLLTEGYIKLGEIPDLPTPTCGNRLMEFLQQSLEAQDLLIACVDNSMMVQILMEKIFQDSQYRFLSIYDALLTIPLLLDNQPDLIFLNLEMPMISGYDLCLQIRKVSILKDIPIVLLAEGNNMLDRMRIKLSGAADCLIKPLSEQAVLAVTEKLFLSRQS